MIEWDDETELNEEPQAVTICGECGWFYGVCACEAAPPMIEPDRPGYVRRLRPSLTEAERGAEYAAPYNYAHWGTGHDVRVRVTVALGSWLATSLPVDGRVVDLSAGDGAIPLGIAERRTPRPEVVLGDMVVPETGWPGLVGPIEETLLTLRPEDRGRTLFVLSETIEHLEDPAAILWEIRKRAGWLLLSTPAGEGRDPAGKPGTPQHLWGWDQDGMGVLLREAGWSSLCRVDTNAGPVVGGYDYQIWACA